MRLIFGVSLLVLTSCSSPGVEVWGGASRNVDVGPYRFKVNYTSDRAEAYRVNMQLRPKTKAVFPAAAQAMEDASGCKVVRSSLSGDVARVTADLLC